MRKLLEELLISNDNIEILLGNKTGKITKQTMYHYKVNENKEKFKNVMKQKPEFIFNSLKQVYGINVAYLVSIFLDEDKRKTFLNDDELMISYLFEFIEVISCSYIEVVRKSNYKIIFEKFCNINPAKLIELYKLESESLLKHKLIILLCMLSNTTKIDGFDVIKEFEKFLKEAMKIFDFKTNKPSKFPFNFKNYNPKKQPLNKDMLAERDIGFGAYGIIEMTLDIICVICMNQSEFLDKFCSLIITRTNVLRLICDYDFKECLSLNFSNNSTETFHKFLNNHRPNIVNTIGILTDNYKAELIELLSVNADDLYNAISFDEVFCDNKEFLFGNTEQIDVTNSKEREVRGYQDTVVIYSNSSIPVKVDNSIAYYNDYIRFFSTVFDEYKNKLNTEFYNRTELIFLLIKDIYLSDFNEFDNFSKYKLSIDFSLILFAKYSVDSYDSIFNSIAKYGEEENVVDVIDTGIKLIAYNNEFTEKLLENYKSFSVVQRFMIIRILALNLDKYAGRFIEITENSKQVNKGIDYTYLKNPKVFIELLLTKLKSKKLVDRKKAFTVFSNIYKNRNVADIKQAFEIESNAKLKQDMEVYLATAVEIEGNGDYNSSDDLNEVPATKQEVDVNQLVPLLLKDEKLINSFPIDAFSIVKNSSGEDVDINYLKASLILYAKDKICGVSLLCNKIVADFEKESFSKFANDLFNYYIGGTIDVKMKWILYYCSIYGGERMVDLYVQVIDFFIDKTRYTLAVEAVRALVLNPSPRALVIVEEFSRKKKQQSIRTASREALTFMAEELNITKEELGDKIIPDFGFDDEYKIVFDFGNRKFNVYLNTRLELEIHEEVSGKILKTLPKIGVNDDTQMAEKSTIEFKALKKQIKATVKTQTERLLLALTNGRIWTYENFNNTFVKNAIMYKFATSLIWGIYQDGNLTDTFRYNDDGTFSNVDDEEFTLTENMIIGLVHPVELSEELLLKWKEQLKDYEIKQSILQLDREVNIIDETMLNSSVIEFDEDVNYSAFSLKAQLIKAGYEPGITGDGGNIYYFTHYDVLNKITGTLNLSGIPPYYDEEYDKCNLTELYFVDENNNKLNISKVSQRAVSELYIAIANTTLKED